MVEAEVAFLDRMEDLLALIEKLVKYVTRKVLNNHEEELCNYRKLLSLADFNFSKIVEHPFTVMSFDDACAILERTGLSSCEGRHLSKEHELSLVKHNNDVPIFLVDWPQESKPFYVKVDSATAKVMCFQNYIRQKLDNFNNLITFL